MSTQYSKIFGPVGLRLLIPYTFHNFCCWCWKLILFCHIVKGMCVLQNCHLSVVLMVDGPAVDYILLQIIPVACAFKNVWPRTAGGPKDHLLSPSPHMRLVIFFDNIFVSLRLQLLFLSLISHFNSL